MKEYCSALCSEYVIDGVKKALTPAELLDSEDRCPAGDPHSPVIDESLDPSPTLLIPDDAMTDAYADAIIASPPRPFPALYAAQYTRIVISRSLTDALWRKGHFRLCDLTVDLLWQWNDGAIGNMAAFYSAAESAATFLDDLALKAGEVGFIGSGRLSFNATTRLLRSTCPQESDLLEELPFHTPEAWISDELSLGKTALDDLQSWIIYIPFDSCDFRLGGSALSEVMGATCGIAPQADDADYFQDCFEVLREMVEDGVILSGRSIGEGGLLPALRQYFTAPAGICADISDIMRSRRESVASRILFSEVPGVLVQIKDIDYEYFDAQMLLQDVEYFPLGHPVKNGRISISDSRKSGISKILGSILAAQSHEGED